MEFLPSSMAADFARTRELLEHTDRSALNIALDVGFKTPNHFVALL
jgi:transcriptional regulator GlxA family with amidase domain